MPKGLAAGDSRFSVQNCGVNILSRMVFRELVYLIEYKLYS